MMDNFKEPMPEWLYFVKGVVNSEDLSLNITRETLQQNKILRVIKKNLIKTCIEIFNELSKSADAYKRFYDPFSKNMKLGVHEVSTNCAKIDKLLQHYLTKNGDEMTSLDDYVRHMDNKQPSIYNVTDECKKLQHDRNPPSKSSSRAAIIERNHSNTNLSKTKRAVETSPSLEKRKKEGYSYLLSASKQY